MESLQLNTRFAACEQEACWGPHGRFKGKLYTGAGSAASFEYASLADVNLCRFRAKGFFRSEPTGSRHIGRYCGVILQLEQTVYCGCNGQTVTLPPRHWMVIDQGRPATAIGPNGNDSLIVMVPRVRLLEKGDDLGAVTMRPFSGEAGVAKLAWQFIGSVFDEISSLRPQFEAGVVDTICQLVRLAMVESSGEPAMGSQQRVLRERVKACILSHLREPELDADRIATELNCTKRYLHKVFETERVSIGDYIRQLRLDRCRDEILAPEYQDKSITEIAFSWGFNSSSHFSAAFKERFGTAPSLFRKVN